MKDQNNNDSKQLMLEENTIGQFMDELASEQPTPGGGAAGGMNGAMGAALVSMVCRVTIKKLKGADAPDGMQEVLDQADQLRLQMLRSAYDDFVAFGKLMDSYRLPKDSEEQITARREQIAKATLGATEVPLRCAEDARKIMQLAMDVAKTGTPSVISDAGAAAASAYAALRVARLNVMINTKHSKNTEFRENAEQRIAASMDGAEELLHEIDSIVSERM